MDDQKLLEMAAKAAEIEYTVSDYGVLMVMPTENSLARRCWNPLADNGDALRLAVVCRMYVFTTGDNHVGATCPVHPFDGISATEPYGSDRCAATRRAITRVAAEIGRTK